jgi:hypothetical protein
MNTREERSNVTRWDELKQSVRVALEILAALHENGVGVRFLNREGVANARSWEDGKAIARCAVVWLTSAIQWNASLRGIRAERRR